MPLFELEASQLDVRRNAMLIDSNVLIRAFESQSDDSLETRYFLDEADFQWLVPVAVVIESWGFLVGRDKNWIGGFSLLAWLNTPGKAIIVGSRGEESQRMEQLMRGLDSIDCVDAILANLATDITDRCGLSTPLAVATYDTSDFYRLLGITGIRVAVYDMRTDFLAALEEDTD